MAIGDLIEIASSISDESVDSARTQMPPGCRTEICIPVENKMAGPIPFAKKQCRIGEVHFKAACGDRDVGKTIVIKVSGLGRAVQNASNALNARQVHMTVYNLARNLATAVSEINDDLIAGPVCCL